MNNNAGAILENAQNDLKAAEAAMNAVSASTHGIKEQTRVLLAYHLQRVKTTYLQKMKEWRENRQDLQDLQKVIQKLNELSREKGAEGTVKVNDELVKLMQKIQNQFPDASDPSKDPTLKVPKVGDTYSKEDRETLMETLNLRVKDMDLEGDMAMQELQQLFNERLEHYQYARLITKPLHEATQQAARKIGNG